MKGFARITLVGHLGKDPESQFGQSGTMFCKFSVAVSGRKRKDSADEPKTQWYNVTAFGKTAEVVGQYCSKGNIVAVLGTLEVREYEYQGSTRYSLDVAANEVQLVDTRNGDDSAQTSGAAAPRSARDSAPLIPGFDHDKAVDDDIPF